MRTIAYSLTLVLLLLAGTSAQAGEMSLPMETGGNFSIRVASLQEKRFRGTVKQQFDFSCGSAAVATLLNYHFEHPIGEQEVFQEMYESGDQDKIRREGFSLLDMKRYLASKGYLADGYQMPLSQLGKLAMPAIALISEKGYRHFVVIKGMNADRVLLGDPATGIRSISHSEFDAMHTGIYFLIRNKKQIARANFNQPQDWRSKESAPISLAVNRDALGTMLLLLPNRYDF